jgi:pseudaminic acid biosynthesis-associated methylase
MTMDTKQLKLWRSEFGTQYTERNRNDADRLRRLIRNWSTILNCATAPYPASVLEVGCNNGGNLLALSHLVEKLHAVEPNVDACRVARGNPILKDADIREGSGFDLPFAGASIDLVFTSGVLIHVAPDDLAEITDEIVRVAKKYVVCIEYFSPQPVSIPYRGQEGYLFKQDFGRHYLDRYPSLVPVQWGFFWKRLDAFDDCNWWLFAKG